MKPRLVVALLTAALIAYFVLIGQKAAALFREGGLVGIGLGTGAVLLPLVGAILLVLELRFGWRTQHLGRRLAAEGALPDQLSLPRRPSGRVDREAALPHFAAMRAAAEADPTNWRVWFRLADAYDLAGDRRRAREAMRQAIELSAVER